MQSSIIVVIGILHENYSFSVSRRYSDFENFAAVFSLASNVTC